MASIGYGRALRAHWFPLLAVALFVMCVAVIFPPVPRVFGPSTDLEKIAASNRVKFAAHSSLGLAPLSGDPQTQFRTISFYLRSSLFTDAFADSIGYTGTDTRVPGELVSAVVTPETGAFDVTGYGGTAAQATEITNDYIQTLQTLLTTQKKSTAVEAQTRAQASVDELSAKMQALGTQIQGLRDAAAAAAAADPTTDPDAPLPVDPQVVLLQSQLDALGTSYNSAYQNLTRLTTLAEAPVPTGLTVLVPPSEQTAVRERPSLLYSLALRVVGGLLLGLMLGAAVALILEHLGRRISSRDAAEAAFRTRVLAEIPKRRFTGSRKDVAVVAEPSSRTASAYRMLRAVLLADQSVPLSITSLGVSARGLGLASGGSRPAAAQTVEAGGQLQSSRRPVAVEDRPEPRPDEHAGNNGSSPSHNGEVSIPMGDLTSTWGDDATVFVLASASDEAIHPIVVANLAASMAEIGRDVVVLRLGAAARAGGAERPTSDADHYDVWAHESSVPGVQTVDLRPGHNTPSAQAVIEALRAEGSIVLIDAGRVATAEFADVAPVSDGVVAVCEYGKTKLGDADRAADIIAWSHASFRGVVLAQVPLSRRRLFSLGRRSSSPLGYRGQGSAA